MTKVLIPKEVAEAIDELLNRRDGRRLNPFGIVKHLDNVAVHESYPELRVLNDYYNDIEHKSPRHPNVLMRALVNGYEVEKVPEEKVREYYDGCRAKLINVQIEGRSLDAKHLEGQAVGVSVTLDILGIKIEGVNE